jgi:hypothetical protein
MGRFRMIGTGSLAIHILQGQSLLSARFRAQEEDLGNSS